MRYAIHAHDGTAATHTQDGATARTAADQIGLDIREVRWAVEEYGRCDNTESGAGITITPAGTPWPGPYAAEAE